jgi:Tol biopolymer transport system component
MKTDSNQLTRREFLTTAAAFAGLSLIANAGEEARPPGSRISYYCNGELHVGLPGQPEGKPLTTGHWDFKPSWSKTGGMLVFFRRLKNDPDVGKWITAACIINVDGTGFHQLSDGTYTDFNPTWTRDGKNIPLWNRKNRATGGYCIMASKVGGKPGEEVALTDKRYISWVHSAVSDGRLLVASAPPKLGRGYYLMTPNPGGEPKFERIECELALKGVLDRVSVSPSEKRICFEFQTGFKSKGMGGRTLYIADFDVQKRAITNPKAFANEAGKPFWFAYPRWIDGEAAVVYHSGETGKNQLYVYSLDDGSTKRVSTNAAADYRYPHGEAAPC